MAAVLAPPVRAAVTVGSSATLLASGQGDRSQLSLINLGAGTVYVGDDNVTTADGFPIGAGRSRTYYGAVAATEFWAASDDGNCDVRVEEVYGGSAVSDASAALIDELRGIRLGLELETDEDLAVTGI